MYKHINSVSLELKGAGVWGMLALEKYNQVSGLLKNLINWRKTATLVATFKLPGDT